MNIRIPASGAAAKLARTYLATQGLAVTHTQALELVARLHGYGDLQAMKADEKLRYADAPALHSASSNEYVLKEGKTSVWLTVDDVTVRVHRDTARKEVVVDLLRLDQEDGAALDQAVAAIRVDPRPAQSLGAATPDAASQHFLEEHEEIALEQIKGYLMWRGGYDATQFAKLLQERGLAGLVEYYQNTHFLKLRTGPYVVFSLSKGGFWNQDLRQWVPFAYAALGCTDDVPTKLLADDAILVPYRPLGNRLDVTHQETLHRIALQLEGVHGVSADETIESLRRVGCVYVLESYDKSLVRLGPMVICSDLEQGYWNEHLGWVFDKRSASGYQAGTNVSTFKDLFHFPDAEIVLYDSAKDFEPD